MLEPGIMIEEFQFDHLAGTNGGYVQVNVYVGMMPAKKAHERIVWYKENSKVCILLKELDIPFDVIGMREHGQQVVIKEES